MKADYLTLADGSKVRVEIDLPAITSWSALTGYDLEAIANIKSDVKSLATLAYCSVVEGESIDGKEFPLTEKEFGRLCRVPQIVDFVKILGSQLQVMTKKK